MVAEAILKATLRQRAMHEFKEFAILAVYLYITLGAVTLTAMATYVTCFSLLLLLTFATAPAGVTPQLSRNNELRSGSARQKEKR